ncbi:MAG: hypothetical protein GXP26_13345 [Planctomycetes bacterium]|nr:hypothetical protein [Planctomycetota bacterium]
MAEYGLLKPFDIDHGELQQLTQQECFVLGYELADIDHLLKQPHLISKPVHADNRERIQKACLESGRNFTLQWMQADPSESWMQLEVPAETNELEA